MKNKHKQKRMKHIIASANQFNKIQQLTKRIKLIEKKQEIYQKENIKNHGFIAKEMLNMCDVILNLSIQVNYSKRKNMLIGALFICLILSAYIK